MSFITPQKVFAHLDRMAAWQHGGKPSPVTIEWDLSNRCVLGCQSCHFAHTHSRGPWVVKDRALPMAYTETGDYAHPAMVRHALSDMAAAGVKGIVWTGGGEPTTHPEWLSLVEHAHAAGLESGMYTLGGLLNPATGKRLGELATWVVVSLDCIDGASYASEKGVKADRYEAACNGVRYLVSGGRAAVGVSFLLHAENWMLAPEMLSVARSLGATYATFRPTIDEGPTDSAQGHRPDWIDDALPMLEVLSQELDVECAPARFVAYRDWTGRSYDVCHGIKFNATVTPDGRMWLCPQRRGMAGSQLGDLRTESFADIWARHPGQWTDFTDCRVMCRLHQMNTVLGAVFAPKAHEAFV